MSRLQAEAGEQRVWFLVDAARRRIVAAPEPARRLWGLPRAFDGQPIVLDAGMPALSDLSGLTASRSSLSLVFWTQRGMRRWRCRVVAQRPRRDAPAAWLVVPEIAYGEQAGSMAGSTGVDPGNRDVRLAHIVHELRTPLAAIQAYADLLREVAPTLGGHDYIESIREAARHALGVVADLSPRARDEVAVHHLPLEPIDVDAVVRSAVEMVRPLALRSSAEIAVVTSAGALTALSHRRALTQILINMLANAVRHAGPAPSIVVKSSAARAGEVTIEISDSGPGIPADAVRLAMRGGIGDHPGAGMGLAISHQLAERAGARLEIGREKGGGAQVRIVLAGVGPVRTRRQVAIAK